MKKYRYADEDFHIEHDGCIIAVHCQDLTGYVGPEIRDGKLTGKFAFATDRKFIAKDGVTTVYYTNLDLETVLNSCCAYLIQQRKEELARQKASPEQACQTIRNWVDGLPHAEPQSN